MKPELEALARRAVACKGWRWMPGMLIADNGEGVRVSGICAEFLHGAAAETPVNRHGPAWMRLRRDSAQVPVVDDPATLGCLLALVREAWSEPILSVAWAGGRWYVVQRILRSVDALRWIDTATEAEALVAALEAAP